MSTNGKRKGFGDVSSQFATWVSEKAGSTWAFIIALSIIVAWAVVGPIFHFSDTWQLVINTGTTIVTFLMVFLIQRAQNKGALAVQLKLNELVAAIETANNRLISVEDLSEDELEILHRHYQRLATLAAHDTPIADTHSLEKASQRHARKRHKR
ncbi:MAG TPA: low affinity iron permease family protein [Thermoanaerobaculia bacterium]|nr:low affinity iron permease family protein [Thermoanaerobaculia bacterium]